MWNLSMNKTIAGTMFTSINLKHKISLSVLKHYF